MRQAIAALLLGAAIWFAVENREALTDAAYDLIACPNC
jgi:hypothetical protein